MSRSFPELAADLEAVDPAQHHVEDDGVIDDRSSHQEGVLATVGDVGEVGFLPSPRWTE